MTDPLDVPKYRNAAHCAYLMIREEGFSSLYKGVGLTALRQGLNRFAVSVSGVLHKYACPQPQTKRRTLPVYQYLKTTLHKLQPEAGDTLPAYQHMIMGFISGACGPLFNAPIDTVKTRIQKNPSQTRGWARLAEVTTAMLQNEGWTAFYKGTTPRVLRVAPGQAITFMVGVVLIPFLKVYGKLGI
jgi:solute carrier family 25 (mitochondrial citrate transporter), member 1